MKRINRFFYAVGQGFKSLIRNRTFSLASVGTIVACMFLFGIFYFVLSNFQYMIKNMEQTISITVFFEEGMIEEAIQAVGKEIGDRPEVAKLKYTSPQEAWEKTKAELFIGKEELVESFGEENPLEDSASYEIYLKDISMQESMLNYLSGRKEIRRINSSKSAVEGFSAVQSLVGYFSGGIIIILIAVSIFLIRTTVTMGISMRKEEISIMRLVGANDFFIQMPFVVEGIVVGVIGAALPVLLLYFLYNRVMDGIMNYVAGPYWVLSNIFTLLDAKTIFSVLIPVSLGLGVGIGFIGSFFTVRKHLKI